MRTTLLLLCIILCIRSVHNSQCAFHPELAGHCGCCPIIGGSCVYFNTIDNIDVSWHTCVPEHLKDQFSLDHCKPEITADKNSTRLCRTKYGIFRLFPQCASKAVCSLTIPRRITTQCHTATAVKGSCDKSIPSFSYDSKRNECIPFTYSGCAGSTNRFLRQEMCEKLCKKSNPNP